jgi:hypothetical protein
VTQSRTLHREILRWLLRLFRKRTLDNHHCFSPREIEDFLAGLLVQNGYEESTLPPEVHLLMTRFSHRIGMLPGDSPETATAKVLAYYQAHPLNPELTLAFQQELRDLMVAAGSTGAKEEAVKKWVCDLSGRLARPTPPEGTVRGPLAQSALRKARKKRGGNSAPS